MEGRLTPPAAQTQWTGIMETVDSGREDKQCVSKSQGTDSRIHRALVIDRWYCILAEERENHAIIVLGQLAAHVEKMNLYSDRAQK